MFGLGHKDSDLLILNKLSDKDLFNFCLTDKNSSIICSNEIFWKTRLMEKYPDSIKYLHDNSLLHFEGGRYPSITEFFKPSHEKTWKNYYLQTIYYIDKMQQDFNFTYKKGDPKNYYTILLGNRYPHLQIEFAAKLGYIDLLEYFLSINNIYKISASSNLFQGAAENNQIEVINHFSKYLTPESAKYGLFGAVLGKNLFLVKFFLDKGASDFTNALKIAKILNNKEIINEIEKRM